MFFSVKISDKQVEVQIICGLFKKQGEFCLKSYQKRNTVNSFTFFKENNNDGPLMFQKSYQYDLLNWPLRPKRFLFLFVCFIPEIQCIFILWPVFST